MSGITGAAAGLEFGVYLPQVSLSFEQMLSRALECERLGYDALWLYDHLYAPGLPGVPSLEPWTLATALLARTSRLRVGHLVLCNNFRHPAVLAKMATTLDVISGGRLEFGIGSGSVADEHDQAGLPWGSPRERAGRLREALEIITRMLDPAATGAAATYQGSYYAVHDLPNLPGPLQRPRPPVHIGGAGRKLTLPLVARYADVWNIPTYALDRIGELTTALDRECERIGRDPASIRRSIEAVMVIAREDRLDDAMARARRHYGGPGYGLAEGGFTGTPARVADRIAELAGQGFSSFIFFTHDRASTPTLELFASEVLPRFERLRPPVDAGPGLLLHIESRSPYLANSVLRPKGTTESMTQVPIADGMLTALDGEPRMLASRCSRCDALAYPVQRGCARCGSVDLRALRLTPGGTVWTWTSQEFLPKAPPYAGPETAETFTPYLVGFVEVPDGLCVEARLVGFGGRKPRIGERVRLVVVPFKADEQGNEVVIPAFAPAGGGDHA